MATRTSELTAADGVLRLHLNESPYGPPPTVVDAVGREFERHGSLYPEGESPNLRRSIAEHLGLPPEMVAVGNGVDELVLLAALAFGGADSTVLMTETTFPGYLFAAKAVNATATRLPLKDLTVPTDDFVTAMKNGADLAYLCNPHNPTGALLDGGAVDMVVTAAENSGTVLIVDEAYMDFAADETASVLDSVRSGRRVIVLRTFSKAWGLASLRTGYAAGPADLIAKLWNARRSLPFNVNRLAQHAVPIALRQTDFLEQVQHRTAVARELLCTRLGELNLRHLRSAANFVMVETGADSPALVDRLAEEHRILVRDLTPFGLDGWARISVGTPEEVDRLAIALRSLRDTAPSAPVPTPPALTPR
ncbi:histidinol-phosphate transaminase [Streptomyces sp. NPDC091215]|uniref:pyridoxal phosphate-dependent aminotransferase n=1 Tax=Streptomyces sp. NPDC091215 TaxID=3155192 RepID=UPI00342963BE